jgi:hypothetical protein
VTLSNNAWQVIIAATAAKHAKHSEGALPLHMADTQKLNIEEIRHLQLASVS